MLREKGLYTEDELSVLLSRAGDLSGQLETALLAASRAVRDGDQEMAGNCVKRANALLNRLGNLGVQEEIRVGRPRTVVQESRDQTLGQIRNAMEEAGLPMPPGCYEEADAEYSFASGCVAAQKLLALKPRPTAVFCISDILALSVISVAQEMGIEVPRALTVTGFDDVDYTTIFHPYLTTIAQPCYEMGRQSTALILDMLRGSTEDIRRRFLPYRLVERESAAPPEKQE